MKPVSQSLKCVNEVPHDKCVKRQVLTEVRVYHLSPATILCLYLQLRYLLPSTLGALFENEYAVIVFEIECNFARIRQRIVRLILPKGTHLDMLNNFKPLLRHS